jgi:hypothetical protein
MPGQHRAGGCADVRAVEIGPDALRQLSDHVLAKACIRARDAGFGACEAGMDAVSQLFSVNIPKILRVGVQHRIDV